MALKLGEELIKAGLISKEDISKALERQVIFGGRLGTNLVELGYIKEDDLARFLSKILRVPYADPSYLEDMDPDVLSSITPAIAEKYLVIPIKKEKNRIHLAMLDPKDFNALDEIRFITGYEITPYIASELRLLHALEKYYDIKRDLRYVTIYGRTEEPPKTVEIKKPPPVEKPVEKPKEEPKVKEEESVRQTHDKLVEEIPPWVFDKKLNLSMSDSKDREEIADILIKEASNKLKRVALFVVKGDSVSGWRGKGLNIDNDLVSGINIPLNQSSLFKEVIDRKNFYQGPLLKIPMNDHLMEAMGGLYPQEVLVFPLTIRGKVVSILYGDDGDRALLLGEYDDLRNLMIMASMAMEILILKRKIMEL
jgi:hypothetical protein